MVYRHRAFQVLIALLVALAGVAGFGVFEFYSIKIDINQRIQAQQNKLQSEFASHKGEIESFIKKNRSEADGISERVKLLDGKIAESNKQLALLEIDAQATVARFAAQVNRKVESESEKALDTVRQTAKLKQKTILGNIDDFFEKEAKPALKSSTEKRIDQILTDPGKPFVDKLKSFEDRVTESQKLMNAIETRQKGIEGRQQLTEKAYSLLPLTNPGLVHRLASYIGEALWVIYGGAVLMFVLVLTNVWLLWRMKG